MHVLALELELKFEENDGEFWLEPTNKILTDARHVDKSRSTCSQGVLKKWLKRNLLQLKQLCAENGIETFRAKSVESLYNQSE